MEQIPNHLFLNLPNPLDEITVGMCCADHPMKGIDFGLKGY